MSVVTKHLSILVATPALAYPPALLPAQCEKPGPLSKLSGFRLRYIQAQVRLDDNRVTKCERARVCGREK